MERASRAEPEIELRPHDTNFCYCVFVKREGGASVLKAI